MGVVLQRVSLPVPERGLVMVEVSAPVISAPLMAVELGEMGLRRVAGVGSCVNEGLIIAPLATRSVRLICGRWAEAARCSDCCSDIAQPLIDSGRRFVEIRGC